MRVVRRHRAVGRDWPTAALSNRRVSRVLPAPAAQRPECHRSRHADARRPMRRAAYRPSSAPRRSGHGLTQVEQCVRAVGLARIRLPTDAGTFAMSIDVQSQLTSNWQYSSPRVRHFDSSTIGRLPPESSSERSTKPATERQCTRCGVGKPRSRSTAAAIAARRDLEVARVVVRAPQAHRAPEDPLRRCRP